MTDKDRRIFDAAYRVAVTSYDDFDQGMRGIAKAFSSGEYPIDWGVQVRETMKAIRSAKVLLSKAINAAGKAVGGSDMTPDEVADIQRSESYLNSRLQRIIAVEETLLNTLLIGDADYTALYIEAQRTHDAMEARIAKEAYGEGGRPDDSEFEIFPSHTSPRVVVSEGEPNPTIIEDPDDIDYEDGPEIVPGEAEDDYDDAEDEEPLDDEDSEEDYTEEEPEDDGSEEEEPEVEHIGGSVSDPEPEISEETPEISRETSEFSKDDPDFSKEPEEDSEEAPSLSEDEIVRQIRDNPTVQQLIQLEAQRIARAQFAAMVSEASAEAPAPAEHPTPQRIEVSTGEDIDASAVQSSSAKRPILHRMRGKADKPAKQSRRSKRKEGSA